MITDDGYPVLIDLDNDSQPTAHVAVDGRLRRLRRHAEIRAYCQPGLLGLPEAERCLPRQQVGPLYRKLVESPITECIKLIGKSQIQSARILHIGPGYPHEIRPFIRLGAKCVALDICVSSLRCARMTAEYGGFEYEDYICGAAELLPFADDAFDIVVMQKTIQWWLEPEIGLRETLRVARRIMIIAEPAGGSVRRFFQRIGVANYVSPVTKRPVNEVTEDLLRAVSPAGTGIKSRRYLSKAIDSSAPRWWVGWVDRRRPLARITVAGLCALNVIFGRLGNQIIAVVEKHDTGHLS